MSAPPDGYTLAIKGLGELRRLARELEVLLRELDADGARARVAAMRRAAFCLPAAHAHPAWLRYFLERALADIESLPELQGTRSSRFSGALMPIIAVNQLLGSGFSGLRSAAQCDTPCSVCGLNVRSGEATIYCAAYEKSAHFLCGELAK